jgi:hypothetical protein
MIYLYAITDPLEVPADVSGLDDAPLETLQVGSVWGVYSRHERLECAPEPTLLWRHDHVVERLLESAGVLPLRFGTVLRDTEELRSILSREGLRFERLLARVRGCVELAVRVGIPVAPDPPPTNGASYMRAKLAAEHDREGAADRILAPLRELAKATSQRHSVGSGAVVSESYLVGREAMEPFIAQVKLLQARNSDVPLSCTGPWGPYSFVDEASV